MYNSSNPYNLYSAKERDDTSQNKLAYSAVAVLLLGLSISFLFPALPIAQHLEHIAQFLTYTVLGVGLIAGVLMVRSNNKAVTVLGWCYLVFFGFLIHGMREFLTTGF